MYHLSTEEEEADLLLAKTNLLTNIGSHQETQVPQTTKNPLNLEYTETQSTIKVSQQ
jgi:hypothetical protein